MGGRDFRADGRPIDPRADHDEWKSLLAAADVRDARLPDARHTAATLPAVLKVPLPAIMDATGWAEASRPRRRSSLTDDQRRTLRGLLYCSGTLGTPGPGIQAVERSVTSVDHSTFGAPAVNFRRTRSSCTGGPALRDKPFFWARTEKIRCTEQIRHTRFSEAVNPRAASSSAMNQYPSPGSSAWISSATLTT